MMRRRQSRQVRQVVETLPVPEKVPLRVIPKPIYNEITVIPEDLKRLQDAELSIAYAAALRENNRLQCEISKLQYEAAQTKWESSVPKFKSDDAKLASQMKTADSVYLQLVEELERRYQFKLDEYEYDKQQSKFIRCGKPKR